MTYRILCFAVSVLLVASAAIGSRAQDPKKADPPPAAFDPAGIDKRIQEIQPTGKEKRFDEIGWAAGLLEAERLARENNRPVFLFCNVGDMDIGRC